MQIMYYFCFLFWQEIYISYHWHFHIGTGINIIYNAHVKYFLLYILVIILKQLLRMTSIFVFNSVLK